MSGNGRRSARSRIKSATDADEDDPLRKTKPNLKVRKDHRSTSTSRAYSPIRIFEVNLKVMLGLSVFAFFVIFFLIHRLVNQAEEALRPRVVTPFPAPKVMDLPQFEGEHRESLYWGTYRPHVYLGIRARTPRSLIAGLMWIGIKDGRYLMRHVCQDSDELSTYGWTHHNGRDFGHQVLVDQSMTLATSFLKSKVDGSGYGGDWAVRIDVQSESERSEDMWRTGHVFFYMADEDGNALRLSRDNLDILEGSLLASGSRMDVGGWQLHLKSMDDLEVHYSGFKTNHIHNLSDLVQENLGAQARKFGQLQLSDTSDDSPNILVFQVSARIPFKTDVVFVSGTGLQSSRVEERVNSLTGTSLTGQLKEKQREFDTKFEKSFNLADKLDSESVIVGKAAIGNMLGGIGYFYGQSKILLPRDPNLGGLNNFISYWPAELYTAVPSRPFFPRGFLWDEGFHQLLIWRWDVHICLDIVGHWLDLMNVDGWIPREQILGAEALSKVPEEFVPQLPTNGNPPTLFLVLRDIVHSLKRNKFTSMESNEISSFLERAFIRLEAWFQWFNTTQSGKETSSYYWHGRDITTTRELNPKIGRGWDLLTQHVQYEVGDSTCIRFWKDFWCGESPLQVAFPELYRIARDKDALISGHFQVRDDQVHWNLDFVRAAHDWELESIASFLDLLCSTKVRGNGSDLMLWLPSPQKGFTVRSFYRILSHNGGCSFPWKLIWQPKVPSRVSFFVWVAALGKILTAENLRKRHIILVSWCCLCKKDGETVDHLLLHCPVSREVWDMVFPLFGVQWVMPEKIIDLLACWQGCFGRHRHNMIWKCVPHCLMWCLWRERNARQFEGCERRTADLKHMVLNTLFDWVSALGCLPCSTFLDFLDLCSFQV